MESSIRKYDNVLVVGNGFDLDLRLPTRYADFLASSWFNELVDANNHIAIHLKDKFEIQKWVDVESELSALSKTNVDRTKPFRKEYTAIRNALFNYIESVDCSEFKTDSSAVNVLRSLANRDESLLVVNFNYTDSVGRVLAGIGNVENACVVSVHGHVQRNDRLVVFGVQDDAKIVPEHAFLLKSASPVLHDHWMVGEAMARAEKSVTLFGHSLGETDHSQFRPFFGSVNKSPTKLRIYYHSQNSHDELLTQMYTLTRREFSRFRFLHDFQMCGPCYDEL